MLELFKKMAADTRIRAAVVALVLALAAFFGYGCAEFQPPKNQDQAADLAECLVPLLRTDVKALSFDELKALEAQVKACFSAGP